MKIVCKCCRKEINAIVYTPEFEMEEPHCIDCRERIGDEYETWEEYYLSEYENLVNEENLMDYGDKVSKQRRDEI